jgi:capsid protein
MTTKRTAKRKATEPSATVKRGAMPSLPLRLEYSHFGLQAAMGYHSARIMRDVDGVTPSRAAGSRHEQTSRERLVDQSREFYRDNLLYGGLINRCLDFTVGNGYELVNTSKETAGLWKAWIDTAEITGRYNGAKLPRAFMREYLLTGEGIALKVKGGKIQLCESEQIKAHGGLTQGVKTDKYGKPLQYMLAPYKNGNLGTPEEKNAQDVIFMCEPERPSSVRGVPLCQTTFPMLHRIKDVLDSEALTWQLLSRIALKHTSTNGEAFGTATNNAGLRVVEMPYSVVFEGSDTEDLSALDFNRPSKDFPASISTFCRFLGLPLGMPLELVLMDFTKSNFSQMRGALVLSWKSFEHITASMVTDFYESLFRWKFDEWVLAGDIEDTPENRQHNWVTPQFPWIDELAEANAIEKKVALGLMTYEEGCKALERESDKVVAANKQTILDAIQIAKEIEEATGERVPWQMFAGRAIGQTEQAEIAKIEGSKPEGDADALPE